MTDTETLHHLLQHRAQTQSDRLAYVFLHEGETPAAQFTYGQLDRAARHIAAHLNQTVATGARVLLLYPAGLEFLAAFMGCLYAGVIAVPAPLLGTLTLKNALSRLQAIVANAQASAILTLERIVGQTAAASDELAVLGALPWLPSDALPSLDLAAIADPLPPADPAAIAYLQYTSGSTSTPKGVMVTHDNLWRQCRSDEHAIAYSPDSVAVTWLPHHHDFGLINGLLQPLFSGCLCYQMSPTVFLKRPLRWLQAISRYGGTHAGAPNFAYELLTHKAAQEQDLTLDLHTWRNVFCGAEPIRWQTQIRFAQTYAPFGLDPAALRFAYGMAEATLAVTIRTSTRPMRMLAVDAAALSRRQVVLSQAPDALQIACCGSLIEEMQVVIVDPETHQPCPPGAVGEIWIAGSSVTAGYWNRPTETAATFHARLAGSHAGPFLRSGDLGFLHDDELFIAGRLKDIIIVRGQNYYPQDIEWAAQRSHPLLRPDGGAAIAIEIEAGSSEQLALVHEVERGFDPARDQDDVIQAIRRAIAQQFGVAIHAIALIKRGMIPKTSSGKIQRHAARQAYLNGALDGFITAWALAQEESASHLQSAAPGADEPYNASVRSAHFSAPRSPLQSAAPDADEPYNAPVRSAHFSAPLEQQLLDIFRTALKLPPTAPLGIEDNFFARGGDSLGVMEVNLLIENRFGPDSPLLDAVMAQLDNLTVARLAQTLRPPPVASSHEAAPRHEALTPPAPSDRPDRRPLDPRRQLTHAGRRLAHAILPYGPGNAYLAWLCTQPWAQNAFFHRQVALLHRVLAALGQTDRQDEVVPHSLACNTWSHWRLNRLLDAPPAQFDRWVSVHGFDRLTDAHAAGRGVILLHAHSVYNVLPMAVLQRRGLTDAALLGGKQRLHELNLGNLALFETARFEEGANAGQTARFARQLLEAHRTLARGGIFHVAADGYQAPRSIPAPFHGRRRHFGLGFAETALNTGAIPIPIFVSLQLDGHVAIHFDAPLTPTPGPRPAQVEDLVLQYAARFTAYWADHLANMRWRHLVKFLALPPWDAPAP